MSEPIRLQKFLANCGLASRRKAEEMILAGRIRVDGQIVTTLGVKVDAGRQKVECDGKQVAPEAKLYYVLLNKPRGYVTTLSDPQGRPVVASLVKDIPVRLFPVGRLDLDTEGALILTNDGSLAQKIQHPSHETNKTYEALIAGHPGQYKLRQLQQGIPLENKQTAPAQITVLKRFQHQSLVRITIHEGRKRQVRKMFEFIGNPVIQLKRIAYGKLYLKNLPPGQYKILNHGDLKKIFL